MPEYVRVKVVGVDAETSVFREQYDANPDAFELLKRAASFPDGSPLPTKHKTTVSTEAAKKNNKSGHEADSEKENI